MSDLNRYAQEREELHRKLSSLVFTKGGNESRWRENFGIFLCALDIPELKRIWDDFDRVDFKDFSQ